MKGSASRFHSGRGRRMEVTGGEAGVGSGEIVFHDGVSCNLQQIEALVFITPKRVFMLPATATAPHLASCPH